MAASDDNVWIEGKTVDITSECLGSGGFGKVFKATWFLTNETVAFKEPFVENINKRQLNKCVQEVEVLSQLKHPNIIQTHGVTKGDRFGIVMEFASFGCLTDLQEDYKPLTWVLRTSLLRDVVAGMCYLHQNNIHHHDLKASNVLVSQTLTAKIGDFGLSQWRETIKLSSTNKSIPASTVTHIAPERLADIHHDGGAKSDVYSFSILTWELLSDNTPYFGIPGDRIVHHVLNDGRPNPKLIRDLDCPQILIRIMLHCWFSKPADRPSFTKVLSDLDAHIKSQADYVPKLCSDKEKLIEKAGLSRNSDYVVPQPESKLPSYESLPATLSQQEKNGVPIEKHGVPIEQDSMPVHQKEDPGLHPFNIPPANEPQSPSSPTSNISAECCSDKDKSNTKSEPSADDLLKLKGLHLDPDLLKGANVQGSHIQVGSNNEMIINIQNTKEKKVYKIKKGDLTASEKVIDTEVMNYISKHAGSKWKDLARKLHFSDGEIDAVQNDNHGNLQETIYQMLRKWKQREGRRANLHELAMGLARAGKGDLGMELGSKYA